MKKINSLLLVLFITGGSHALAEDPASLVNEPDGITTQPTAIDTSVFEEKKRASKPKTDFRDNIFYGGYINLSFGSYKVIGIEPLLGYRLTPKLSTGVKVRYNYIQDDRSSRSYSTSTYGGSIFGRYVLTENFYAQAEAATYNYEFFYINGGEAANLRLILSRLRVITIFRHTNKLVLQSQCIQNLGITRGQRNNLFRHFFNPDHPIRLIQ